MLNLGAVELATRIRNRELTATEVVDAHIRRIQEVEPQLNALAVPLWEEARQAAAAADSALAHGLPLGPLHGVPITIKEEFLVAGTPTTFGIMAQAGHRASEDGPLVHRLKEAGAIVLGKTNVPQLLLFLEADNRLYGRTANPWNPERTPGGSSGGEAALIAAGGSALGLGADLGGSIRVPAHFCGIHGLRPTARRLTDRGRRHDLVAPVQHEMVAQPGLLARRVEDLICAMNVLTADGVVAGSGPADSVATGSVASGPVAAASRASGPAPAGTVTAGRATTDPDVPPVPWRHPAALELAGLRVAVFADDGYFPASPAIRRVVEEAGRALETEGAEVEAWHPPNVEEAVDLFFSILSADGGAAYRNALSGERPLPQIAGLMRVAPLPKTVRMPVACLARAAGQRRLARVIRSVGRRSAESYWALVEKRRAYRRRFLTELSGAGFDLLVCPPAALPAVPHGSTEDLSGFASYAMLFNVLELPAGVVAAGRVREGEESDRPISRDRVERAARQAEEGSVGLPVGVQIAGLPWREDTVLAAMRALEEHFRSSPEYPHAPPV